MYVNFPQALQITSQAEIFMKLETVKKFDEKIAALIFAPR